MPLKILVVEDEVEILKMLGEYLELKSFSVHLAWNGEEAWRRFSKNSPDIILSDLVMPKMNGNELFQRISDTKAGKKIQYIFMTGTPELVETESAVAIIRKPFSMAVLDNALEIAKKNIAKPIW